MRASAEGIDVEAVVAKARELGVLGWARPTGEVHAEGAPDAVQALIAFLGDPATANARVEGHEQFAVRGVPAGAFLVHEHAGGFDLHLEVADAVASWRLRKAPSMDPAQRRMAIELEGAELPDDSVVWDRGLYEQGGRVAWPEALERGHAVFVLRGERLRGGFALQRTRGAQWLFIKRRDAHALPGG